MLYIITALKPEAQAFIDRYRLKKKPLSKYKIFTNNSITLIISAVGVLNAREATQTLINHFDITDEDIYLNVGICGASREYKIGELLEVSTLVYKEQSYPLLCSDKKSLYCVDKEATTDEHTIVDMESYGVYDAVIHSPAIKKFHILKVVSDYFEPHKVTKERTKMLIFNQIDAINSIVYKKDKS